MKTHRKRAALIAAIIALAAAAALAAGNVTDASVAKLAADLGKPKNLEVDEVRVTNDGVACIEYRLQSDSGRQALGHAVVRGDEVLRSPAAANADPQEFEKAWKQHCLGPHGGMTIDQ